MSLNRKIKKLINDLSFNEENEGCLRRYIKDNPENSTEKHILNATKMLEKVDKICEKKNYSFADHNVKYRMLNDSNNVEEFLDEMNLVKKRSKELNYNPNGAFLCIIYTIIENNNSSEDYKTRVRKAWEEFL